jgi:SAM-dependent methyltransferase
LFEWNHNTHYHKFLLDHLPEAHESALDIGSGLGLFSYKISSIFKEVLSLEPDQKSIDYSKTQYGGLPNVVYLNDSFMEYNFTDQKFDFVAAIASIHHMDFASSLEKMRSLLNPGGKIIILGLYKESSVTDLIISLIAILPNFILNLLSKKNERQDCDMITAFPTMTIKEIKNAASEILKKYRFRRHLFWRYSIQYESDSSPQ